MLSQTNGVAMTQIVEPQKEHFMSIGSGPRDGSLENFAQTHTLSVNDNLMGTGKFKTIGDSFINTQSFDNRPKPKPN